tara:strand:- start:397 stop:684 length:288 start_codon:yes stop_codon:yes gene_type:complete
MKHKASNKKKSAFFPLIPINHRNRHFSFFFQAIFTSLVVALAFLIDEILKKYVSENESNTTVKVIGQFLITMVISLIVIYALYFCFGWGDALLGR